MGDISIRNRRNTLHFIKFRKFCLQAPFLVLGNEEKVVAVKEKIRESYYLRKDNKEYTD